MTLRSICLPVCLLIFSAGIVQGQAGKTAKVQKTIAKQKKDPVVLQPVAPVDPVLLTVGGDPVSKGEFESIYRKNNQKDSPSDRKALEEYLELFINFKLKVKAAKELGKDTVKGFKSELRGYRKQLAQPYLNDKQVTEHLIDEAYQRMKKDVRASHILVKLPADPLPKDTLAAWNKAIEIRNRLIKGEDFSKLAETMSDDPSAKQNHGDLGYFSSMMMVYPFENAAYTTPVGQISMPVRTKFGYHILKVADIRDARGQVHVAHVMVQIRENASDSVVEKVRKKVDEIYQKAIAGEDFAKLASTYSDDRTSGRNGGELPWFGAGKMVPEFENAAFELKEVGDISKPIRSPYGFHIIKLLGKKPVQSFEEVKSDLKQKIAKDSRSQVSRNAVIDRVKAEAGFTEQAKALNELISKVDTSYLKGKWTTDKVANPGAVLFSVGTEPTYQMDFAKFIAENQTSHPKDASVEALVRKAYEAFRDDRIIAYEDARLEQKYPEFRMLMQEYHDGILLFDITDQLVWSKALKDTAGLEAFHEQNKMKYMWGDRVEAVVYKCKDEKTAKAVRKMVEKRAKKGYSTDAIKKKINEKSELNLQTEEGTYSKGDNESVDKVSWIVGISPDAKSDNGSVSFVEIRNVLAPAPKTLQEAKGLITADYQSFLEQEWIKELRAKYKVDVNREVFDSIR
ncbi:MAG: peptidylprolyl isomerase [Bacteroidia bacterium]|nr:peptidyl-prolyl cis-trans isomerase [Bacteroidia bacterium]MCC6768037.1 peptidylprolyl isomerase [Bacteroidia bacterium]